MPTYLPGGAAGRAGPSARPGPSSGQEYISAGRAGPHLFSTGRAGPGREGRAWPAGPGRAGPWGRWAPLTRFLDTGQGTIVWAKSMLKSVFNSHNNVCERKEQGYGQAQTERESSGSGQRVSAFAVDLSAEVKK